jgi:hypothetical protein
VSWQSASRSPNPSLRPPQAPDTPTRHRLLSVKHGMLDMRHPNVTVAKGPTRRPSERMGVLVWAFNSLGFPPTQSAVFPVSQWSQRKIRAGFGLTKLYQLRRCSTWAECTSKATKLTLVPTRAVSMRCQYQPSEPVGRPGGQPVNLRGSSSTGDPVHASRVRTGGPLRIGHHQPHIQPRLRRPTGRAPEPQ